VQARALKRTRTEQLEERLQVTNPTSRSQLDRVLDPEHGSVQPDTLINAARAVGKEVEIRIKRLHRRAAWLPESMLAL